MKNTLGIFLIFLGSLSVRAAGTLADELSLSMDQYVKQSLEKSDSALTLFNNYQNSTLGYQISYRQLRLPSLSVDSILTKNKSDTNSVINRDQSASANLNLSQPLYLTGARLTANTYDTSSLSSVSGVESHSFTRPAYLIGLSQPLYLFVGNTDWRTWKRSQISYDSAKDNYQYSLMNLENNARAKYYTVLLNGEQLEVEKAKLESSKRGFDVTKALVDAGRLAEIEVARSMVRLQADTRTLQNAKTTYEQSINDARQFASLNPATSLKFTTKLTYTPIGVNVDRLIAYALKHRPDYVAAVRNLELSRLTILDTKEQNAPHLNAVASYGRTRSETDDAASLNQEWRGALNLNWTLFDSRVNALQIQSAQNSLTNDEINLKNFERSIKIDVTNAYLNLKNTESQLDDLKFSIQQAKNAMQAVRIRYQNGKDRLIDVFDAESQVRNTETEYLNVVVAANTAKDNLAVLIGGRLDQVEP